MGKADAKTRMVQFSGKKYQIDRDILGAINVALRNKTDGKHNKIVLNFNENKKILMGHNEIKGLIDF